MDRKKIFTAIEEKKPIRISVSKGNIVNFYKIIPEKITGDNTVVGKTVRDDQEVIFDLEDVLVENINVSAEVLDKIDTKKLGDVSETADINITESEDGDFNVEIPESNENEEEVLVDQELSKENIKTWAAQIKLKISNIKKLSSDILACEIVVKNLSKLALIYPNGDIKLSGHLIEDFNDFKNIIKYFNEN